ncbi:ABC-type sugar transport systems,permease component, putative [Babesia ovis]|uniref:ABC-type sugar transport systems,permease component, putative n=1 Tax=Babesia ovis TaxID=5869 RepID=A0A9W5T9F2_BABOV|nr:ABC-type sugar transport systems,permease component, putative [Babesia ovis]
MRVSYVRSLYQRLIHTNQKQCPDVTSCDVALFPGRILSLLPKQSHRRLLNPEDYASACALVRSIEHANQTGDITREILQNHGSWIAALQRASVYKISLIKPLKLLNEIFENGQLKLRGLSSREFATLASVCARQRSPDSDAILDKMCDTKVLDIMLPDLMHSDYALFLSSLARTGRVQHIGATMDNNQGMVYTGTIQDLSRRVGSMNTFDIALTFDAISALRQQHLQITRIALSRFHNLLIDGISNLGHNSVNAGFRVKRGIRYTRGIGHTQSPFLNDIALFLRAIVRADAVGIDMVHQLGSMVSHLKTTYRQPGIIAATKMVSISTTILMSMCCLLAKFGWCKPLGDMDDLVVHILQYLQAVPLKMVSIKERTKICLAVQTYWHLANGKKRPELVHHIYNTIVDPCDIHFKGALDMATRRGLTNKGPDENIIDEVTRCLMQVLQLNAGTITKVTAPPYVINVVDP